MDNLGLLTGLAAALAWGTYMVPFKLSKSTNFTQFQLFMGLGILVSGFLICLMTNYSLSLNAYGILAGVLWGVANAAALVGVSNLGISKGVPIMASLVVVISFLFGAIMFGELPEGLMFGMLGIGMIILGVMLVSSVGNSESQNFKKGLIACVVAGMLFGVQFVPIKTANLSPSEYFFSMSFGIFLTSLIIAFLKKVKLDKGAIKESLLSGAIWNIGNLAGVMTISLIGLAKGLPITQASVLIAVLWGILYFKEIRSKKKIIQVLFGSVALLVGVIILGSA